MFFVVLFIFSIVEIEKTAFASRFVVLFLGRGEQRLSVRYGKRLYHRVDIPRHKRVEVVLAKPDTVIGYAALREVIGADTLASIPNVLTVSFDPDSENSYKDGNALFVILADGNEYSAVGRQVVEDVKAALDSEFSGRIHYGGAIVEKAKLRAAIEGEIPFILAISVCLAIAIMLLTSKSWLEPFVLLAVSGVAILLNMGTNALLGEISYITNAVGAILQLALSIDYSIVLTAPKS